MTIKDTTKNPHPEWLFGGNPGMIEAQEEDGQRELCDAKDLPRRCNSEESSDNAIPIYKKLGIKVFDDKNGDNLFVRVQLPKGWKIIATEHSMWSNLQDDNGRIRAKIFYKAAFYDRSSHISFTRRYRFEVITYLENEGDSKCGDDFYDKKSRTPIYGKVIDADSDEIIFETTHDCFAMEHKDGNHEEWWKGYGQHEKAKRIQCINFLDTNYPDWKDIFAYW